MTNAGAAERLDLDAILVKIAKCQKLAAKAGTPEEAAAAAEMASRLMEKYGIEKVSIDIDAKRDDTSADYGSEKRGDVDNFMQQLVWALARDNRCRAVRSDHYSPYGKRVKPSMTVIGRRDDVNLVWELAATLGERIKMMADVTWATEGKPGNSYRDAYGRLRFHQSPFAWKNAYRMGVVAEIDRRLSEARKARERERLARETTALVVIDNKVNELTKELFPRLGRGRPNRIGNDNGYGAGRRDGRSMDLARSHLGGGALRLGAGR